MGHLSQLGSGFKHSRRRWSAATTYLCVACSTGLAVVEYSRQACFKGTFGEQLVWRDRLDADALRSGAGACGDLFVVDIGNNPVSERAIPHERDRPSARAYDRRTISRPSRCCDTSAASI